MKLYITPGSPYARMARIVVIEKALQGRVEVIVAQTRVADSPYYAINPSGRVPYLIRDDGVGLEESALICAYLDHLDGKPKFHSAAGDQAWQARRLEALARSMLDGLGAQSAYGGPVGKGGGRCADARVAQHGAAHARMRTGTRGAQPGPSVAPAAPKAV
jgi:glutathione S-transferase